MKIDISQKITKIDGKPFIYTDTNNPFTLKSIAIEALLFPKGMRNPQTGATEGKEDTFEEKMAKYRIYEKLKDAGKEVELTAEEIAKIKKLIGEIKPQLIVGQAVDFLECKQKVTK